MKRQLFITFAGLLSGLAGLGGQTIDDPNEGLSISGGGAGNITTLSWFGREDRTYFIQKTDDLHNDWTYGNVIEPGQGLPVDSHLTHSGDSFFARLRFTDRVTLDPNNEDFDQDQITNMDEVFNETDPFSAADTNGNTVPDDWEIFWFGDLNTVTLSSSYPDGDAFTDVQEYAMGTDPKVLTVLSVTYLSGDNQIATADSLAPAPLLVTVEDSSGKRIRNAPVTFTISSAAERLARVVSGTQPPHLSPVSETADYDDTIVVLTDSDGIAQLDYQIHPLAPATAGQSLTVRAYVTESVNYHDFTIYANQVPTDIIFTEPLTSHVLSAISLPDTILAGTSIAELDFIDADSTVSGSFEVLNYSDSFSILREGSDWLLVTASGSDFFEKAATVYDLQLEVADGHGGVYQETLQITVADADPNDSPILAAPSVNQVGGEFQTEQSLTLTNGNGHGLIFYTLDGSDPKINGQLYTAETVLLLESGFQGDRYETIQLRAVIRDNGLSDSPELSETYIFKPAGNPQEIFIRASSQDQQAGPLTLTTSNVSSTPIPKARLGKGWIVNDSFVPDLSQLSQDIYVQYYDPHGYTASNTGNERFILTTDVINSSVNSWRKIKIGRGWIGAPGGVNVISGTDSHDSFTGKFIPDPLYQETIYLGFKRFSRSSTSNALSFMTQSVLTTDPAQLSTNYITLGSGKISHAVGTFEQLTFTPDLSQGSQPVYFGFNLFEHDNSFIASKYARWVYTYDASEISDDSGGIQTITDESFDQIQLSDGWITGVGGLTIGSDAYIPDFDKAPTDLYGGLKWVKSNDPSNDYNFDVANSALGIDQANALREAGWIACSVDDTDFSSAYREHPLGLGWTTDPFSYQPYIDPNGFAGNPPASGVRYRRLSYHSNDPESSDVLDRMDYLMINEGGASFDFYAPTDAGWAYRQKGRSVEMDEDLDLSDFISLAYDDALFLSSLDPMFTQDTDRDGLADGFEIFSYHTDPYSADTDGDLIPDGVEIAQSANGLDPKVKDDALAAGYIQDVALLGQGVDLPVIVDSVDPQVDKINSGHAFSANSIHPPQIVTGSRYRKIGLNGFPLPDEAPQAEEEEDQEKEESFIDAFDLTLNHSVTDHYIPLPGSSDLALQVRRNFNGAIWDSDNGLRPGERLDRPFGAGWSSNLTAFVNRIYNHNGDYDEIEVQDESGVTHRFLRYDYQNATYYMAIPSSRSQQDALLHTLTHDGSKYIFTKKYGTTLTFESDEINQDSSLSDRNGSGLFYQGNNYSRVSTITDRHGNELTFSYEHVPSHEDASLIPQSITYNGRNSANQTISIDASRYRVNSITDPRGHRVDYRYENLAGGVVDGYNATYSVPVLSHVEFALSTVAPTDPAYDGAVSAYTYDLVGEADYSFAGSSGRKSHLNLATIADANQNTYRFSYDFNRTNRVAGSTGSDGKTMWFVQNGYPRQVVRVDLPGSGASAHFEHIGLSQYINDIATSQIGTSWEEYLAGYRATIAYDAENNAHLYQFNNPRIETLDDPYSPSDLDPRLMYFLEMKISHYEGSNLTLTPPTISEGTAGDPATFTSGIVTVTTGGSTTLMGAETYSFDLTSGLQLASVTDFSGNVTDYFYETSFPQNSNYFIYNTLLGKNLNPYFNSTLNFGSQLPEPTKKIMRNARWNGSAWEDVTEQYTYSEDSENIWYLMDSVIDGRGNKTVYDIDANGNRASESIYDASDLVNPVQRTIYSFGDTDFPSVATKVTKVDLNGSEDLSTYNTLDDLGRVQIQAVDVLREGESSHPNALITAFAYDANSNRTHMVDPNTAEGVTGDLSDPAVIQSSATYTWTYDTRNRRIATLHPATFHPVSNAPMNPAASEHTVYDKRGNRVGEIDLNGNVTVHQYDGLNRKQRSIRVMGSHSFTADDYEAFRNYSPAESDLVTNFGYNRLNSMVYQEDAQSNRSFLFYDGLQRLERTLDAEDNETLFEYDAAYNTGSGVFDRDRFKPTRTVDARSYETRIEYDAEGRPIFQFAQYAQDSPNRYKASAYIYDAAGNATQETVYLDYAGLPDSASLASNLPLDVQITQSTYDALNRPRIRTRADDSKESYQYSSTGLLEAERLFHIGDDPLIDAPFREQSHFYDGAGRALASRSLAIAPEQEGEITWVIQGQRYDTNGNVIEVIDPRNVQYGDIGTYTIASPPVPDHSGDLNWETRYDSRNRPVMQIEPRSENLSRTLIATNGSQTTETLSDIRPYQLTEYDQAGNPTVQIDAFGHETITLYDSANRPTHEFTAPVTVLDPFDATQSTVKLAHVVKQHVHDKNGNILQTRSGLASVSGNTTPSAYLAPPDAVDAEGNVLWPDVSIPTRPTAATSVTWLRTDVSNTYDALNRLERTTDGEGITVVNEYDPASNRSAMIDGEQQRTEFEYDGFNRNTVMRHPDNSEKVFGFNALTQTTRTDEEGQVTNYSYDLLNRLKTVNYAADSSIDREYFYDPEGNILAVTEVPGDSIRQTNVAYAYDAAGRLSKECLGATHQSVIDVSTVAFGELASGVGTDGVTHEYSHDLAGNLTEVRYGASNRVLRSTYDLLNRAQTIDDDLDDNGSYDPAIDRRTRYVYDLRGSTVRKETADGLSIQHSFDPLQRCQQITGPLDDYGVTRYTYQQSYDFAGNVGRVEEDYPSFLSKLDDRSMRNSYDLADRLTKEQITRAGETITTSYAYDDAHNRISKVLTKADGINPVETLENISYTLSNDLNQVDSYTDSVSSETVSFLYDLNGARTSEIKGSETTIYGYDFENRLITLTTSHSSLPTVSYAYTYDYRTRRVVRDESQAGGDKTFVVYSAGLSVQEWKSQTITDQNLDTTTLDDTLQVEYVRGSGLGGGIAGLLYTVRDLDADGNVDDIRLNHYNARGDLVAQMDHRGEVMYQAAYEAFGESGDSLLGGDVTDPRTQTEGSTVDRQRSNTKDRDPTGLTNENMRYRKDHLFLTRDPLMFVDGPNMYTYVVQNPWTMFDPTGLKSRMSGGKARAHQAANDAWRANGGWSGAAAGAWSGLATGTTNLVSDAARFSPGLLLDAGISKLTGQKSARSEIKESVDSYNVAIKEGVADVTGKDANSKNFGGGNTFGEFVAPLPPIFKAIDKFNDASKSVQVTESALSLKLADPSFQKLLGQVDCIDCSDIAYQLFSANGKKGKVMEFKSPKGGIKVTEFDEVQEFDYHQVFVDGDNVYDPRYSTEPVPMNDYVNELESLNPEVEMNDVTPNF